MKVLKGHICVVVFFLNRNFVFFLCVCVCMCVCVCVLKSNLVFPNI